MVIYIFRNYKSQAYMYKQHLNLYLPKEDLHVMVKKAGGQTGITASQFAQYLACMAGARKGKGDQLRAMLGGGGGDRSACS